MASLRYSAAEESEDTLNSFTSPTFKEETKAIMVNDVARAFFEAPVDRAIAVELSEEDGGGPGCPMVGLLQKSLYEPRTSRKIQLGRTTLAHIST